MAEREEATGVVGLVVVWAALLALLALTWALSYVDLGPLNLWTSLAISAGKALLVLLFYMELKSSKGLVRLVAGAAAFWVSVMMVLTLADYLARGPRPF